jgi:30S ribosomal protein S31
LKKGKSPKTPGIKITPVRVISWQDAGLFRTLFLYIKESKLQCDMGKGDKKSKRGKIANKSYGVRRPRKIRKKTPVEEKISIQGKS